MAEVKDKIVTVESLSALHEHNKEAYMTKVDPTGAGSLSIDGNGWFAGDVYVGGTSQDDGDKLTKTVDLGSAPLQRSPLDFTSFILEIADEGSNSARYITFTDVVSNSSFLSTCAKAFQFDGEGNMLLYELLMYHEEGGYVVEPTLTIFKIATGDQTVSSFEYTNIYGVQYI